MKASLVEATADVVRQRIEGSKRLLEAFAATRGLVLLNGPITDGLVGVVLERLPIAGAGRPAAAITWRGVGVVNVHRAQRNWPRRRPRRVAAPSNQALPTREYELHRFGVLRLAPVQRTKVDRFPVHEAERRVGGVP